MCQGVLIRASRDSNRHLVSSYGSLLLYAHSRTIHFSTLSSGWNKLSIVSSTKLIILLSYRLLLTYLSFVYFAFAAHQHSLVTMGTVDERGSAYYKI